MKPRISIGFFLLLAMLFQPAWSQTKLLDGQIGFADQTAPIKELLTIMESIRGFTFSYGSEVPVDRSYHVTAEQKSIREHLNNMFKDDSLAFIERGNKILIVPASSVSPKEHPSQTVRGQVLDLDTKLPLVGVNVLLGSVGPEKGTITDVNGYFRFDNVPVGRHDIQCSYIGYELKALKNFQVISGKEFLANMEMEESVYTIS